MLYFLRTLFHPQPPWRVCVGRRLSLSFEPSRDGDGSEAGRSCDVSGCRDGFLFIYLWWFSVSSTFYAYLFVLL